MGKQNGWQIEQDRRSQAIPGHDRNQDADRRREQHEDRDRYGSTSSNTNYGEAFERRQTESYRGAREQGNLDRGSRDGRNQSGDYGEERSYDAQERDNQNGS